MSKLHRRDGGFDKVVRAYQFNPVLDDLFDITDLANMWLSAIKRTKLAFSSRLKTTVIVVTDLAGSRGKYRFLNGFEVISLPLP